MAEEMLPQEIYLICPPSELHQQTISVESGQNNQMKSILVTDHTEGFDKMYHEDLVKKEAIDDDYPPINDIEYHNCPLCPLNFIVKSHLVSHLQNAHKMGDKTTDSDFHLDLQHQQQLMPSQPPHPIHISKKTFACHLCEKQFTQACNLKTHMRVHSGERPYECEECLRQFTNKVNLQTHMRTHTGEKPFTCDTCNSQFTQVSSLKVHMRSHTGERPYLCKTCSRGFTKSSDLNRHVKTHLVERPHKCRVCMRGFTQVNSLQMHMRLHTNYRPYTCFLCDKRFARISCLKAHTKLHTDLSNHDHERHYQRHYQHYDTLNNNGNSGGGGNNDNNPLQHYSPAQDTRNYYDFVNEVNKAVNFYPSPFNLSKTPTAPTTTTTHLDADNNIDSATIDRIIKHHGEYERVVMPDLL